MIKNNTYLLFILILLFTGCNQYNNHINKNYKTKSSLFSNNNDFINLNSAVKEIANQLLLNIPSTTKKHNKFVITSFVHLENFTKSSSLGRVVSESLIDELHKRKFKIIDFRSQESISVNNMGEFSLTRDIARLKDEMPEALVVVGTYSILNETDIVLNARIMNNFTSDVISTAKVIYKYYNCEQFNICKKKEKKEKPIITEIPIVEYN